MLYTALLVVTIGLVFQTRCNPISEDRGQCIEDDQICKYLVDNLKQYEQTGYYDYSVLAVCEDMLASSLVHELIGVYDRDTTWRDLCPVTCKMCPTTHAQLCSTEHPGRAEFAEMYAMYESLIPGYISTYVCPMSTTGVLNNWCPKMCGKCTP